MALTSYAIALGSNRRSRHGSPAETVRAAADALGARRLSRIRATAAVGPAGRAFANAAGLVESALEPPDLLSLLKGIERDFGRRGGRRWGPRVLDLDIILWSEGSWAENGLVVPHPEFRRRGFVLEPLAELLPGWRDPVTGATVRQLLHRLRRSRPVDRAPARS
ncbi:MAG: 2-amino-4-hydroxy-6-hydroxymethyldihydropteridine diphosphokinase [Sphingomonadales bacterium]|jgi:2-amino-4-hydroxy-6-hydroxymethyldihydropteridine diphosphokinase|nr:2-amino-4-hydroxy-6-hydroxymethyldihydropteridine diphosphokinase [Sphingomonadales bacterium]MEA3049431.1 2-amino-4-hydroxy-6-hydroxymethyldihydropteridine diphosphokinase [Sphingomonadales bacterium]